MGNIRGPYSELEWYAMLQLKQYLKKLEAKEGEDKLHALKLNRKVLKKYLTREAA